MHVSCASPRCRCQGIEASLHVLVRPASLHRAISHRSRTHVHHAMWLSLLTMSFDVSRFSRLLKPTTRSLMLFSMLTEETRISCQGSRQCSRYLQCNSIKCVALGLSPQDVLGLVGRPFCALTSLVLPCTVRKRFCVFGSHVTRSCRKLMLQSLLLCVYVFDSAGAGALSGPRLDTQHLAVALLESVHTFSTCAQRPEHIEGAGSGSFLDLPNLP